MTSKNDDKQKRERLYRHDYKTGNRSCESWTSSQCQ